MTTPSEQLHAPVETNESHSPLLASKGVKGVTDPTRLQLQSAITHAEHAEQTDTLAQLSVIREVNDAAQGICFYKTTRPESLHEESNLTFRVSPEPFALPDSLDLPAYGRAAIAYYKACGNLLTQLPLDHRWHRILNHSKPQWMIDMSKQEQRRHLFLRPDLILTDDAPVVTELETSPFGAGLSHFLDAEYKKAGKETLCDESKLLDMLSSITDGKLCLAYTAHTNRYQGQLEYLARVLSEHGTETIAAPAESLKVDNDYISSSDRKSFDAVYRAFYLFEASEDKHIEALIRSGITYPACKPQLEEKALMALLWDQNQDIQQFFKQELSAEDLQVLRTIMPKTWVVDPAHVPEELPINAWTDLAGKKRQERRYVLKSSGFSPKSCWAQSVTFLHTLSQQNCREALTSAAEGTGLCILQEFRRGKRFSHPYFDFHSKSMEELCGRVRLTPCFSVDTDQMLTTKATMCDKTDLIHATVDSINVPVVQS